MDNDINNKNTVQNNEKDATASKTRESIKGREIINGKACIKSIERIKSTESVNSIENIKSQKGSRCGDEALWINSVRKRKNELETIINKTEEAISAAPEGHLRVQDRKSYALYYWIKQSGDTIGTLIPKKKRSIAMKLAQKDYDQKLVKMAKKEQKALSKYLLFLEENVPATIYDNLSEKRRVLVAPFMLADEEYIKKWLETPYELMGFEEEAPEYYSEKGVRVRSKSELIIADMLEKYGIPYKYEYPLKLGKKGTVRPDFTCLNVRTRKEYIWEHFGMMGNPEYANKNVMKINAYGENGFEMGNNFIMTFETSQSPINSNIIRTMVKSFLL